MEFDNIPPPRRESKTGTPVLISLEFPLWLIVLSYPVGLIERNFICDSGFFTFFEDSDLVDIEKEFFDWKGKMLLIT
ncbi:MAG: hypothetical protein ACTSV0_06565 [Candidatus Freyarchaeota archaeon]